MDASALGKLPPEIRNHIYDLLLPPASTLRRRIYRIEDDKRWRRFLPWGAENKPHQDLFALAQTCKQAAGEALSLYYGHHHFRLVVQPFLLENDYLSHLPRKEIIHHVDRTDSHKEPQALLNSSPVFKTIPFRTVELLLPRAVSDPQNEWHCKSSSIGARDGQTFKVFLEYAAAAFGSETTVKFTFGVDTGGKYRHHFSLYTFTLPLRLQDQVFAQLELERRATSRRYLRALFTAASEQGPAVRE